LKALVAVFSVILVLMLGCAQQPPPANVTPNDTDAQGCKAGTTWCPELNKCISAGEPCKKACTQEAKVCPDGSTVGRTGPNCEFAPCPPAPPVVGNDTDEHGCKPSAGYSWCEILKKCVREWETPCVTLAYTVKTANTSEGEILVDERGYTLYTFTADSINKSSCYGACANNWPPLLVTEAIVVPKGMPGTMGAIIRDDNTTQVTYNGWPLYYYAGDNEPGDTNGQGAGGKWYVVKPEDK
jgi:predicted lipoprotein with Yx(FWY)xxD motif